MAAVDVLTIYDRFKLQAEKRPLKKALIFERTVLTYAQLDEQVTRLGDHISACGIRRGDALGVMLPNCPEFVVVMLAAAKLGITLVPENMTISPRQALTAFQATSVVGIIGWQDVIGDLQETFGAAQYDLKLWLGVTKDGFISLPQGGAQEAAQGELSDIYILTMTSGSTGDPKPIVLLQSTKIKRADAAIAMFGLGEDEVILAATPLYHSLAERLVIVPMLLGATLVLMPGFTAEAWLESVNRHGVTFTMAVSTQLKQIYREMTAAPRELPSLHTLVSTSERLDAPLRMQLVDFLQCRFYECYGTSEIACVTLISDAESAGHPDSVGQALDYVELKILDAHKHELPTGSAGEIACKTPLAYAGYYKRPDMTEAAMHNGFFLTGDIGRVDSDGYLYYLGRIKDVIVTGGINVYPKDIETLLSQHENVLECAVIPLPDEQLGEQVTAVVVLRDPQMKMRELQRLCARELADYQQPRDYIVVDALPRNTMGKILKRDLVEKFSEGAA